MPRRFRYGTGNHSTVLIHDSSPPIAPLPSTYANSAAVRIYAFDLDDTLISSDRGSTNFSPKFPSVVPLLQNLYDSQTPSSPIVLAIVTNESLGNYVQPESLRKFVDAKTSKIKGFVELVNRPMLALAPTAKDDNRKDKSCGNAGGCWILLQTLIYEAGFEGGIDWGGSFFCGDAGGGGKSWGRYDLDFAEAGLGSAAGVRYYREGEFFLEGKGEVIVRENGGTKEQLVAVAVAIAGAGVGAVGVKRKLGELTSTTPIIHQTLPEFSDKPKPTTNSFSSSSSNAWTQALFQIIATLNTPNPSPLIVAYDDDHILLQVSELP